MAKSFTVNAKTEAEFNRLNELTEDAKKAMERSGLYVASRYSVLAYVLSEYLKNSNK